MVNKSDTSPVFDLDRDYLTGHFPFITAFFTVSAFDNSGFEGILPALFRHIHDFNMYKMTIPVQWLKVMNHLNQNTRGTVRFESVMMLFHSHGIIKAIEHEHIYQLLKDLGLAVLFPDDPEYLINLKWLIEQLTLFIKSDILSQYRGYVPGDAAEELLDSLFNQVEDKTVFVA